MVMHYADVHAHDIANGPGIRLSLFVSGCTHHCPGCFNEVAQDFEYGKVFSEDVQNQLLDQLAAPYYSGVTLLGGEPMEPANRAALLPFVRRIRETYPKLSIWCYSGYTYEELQDAAADFLGLIDVLVDGEFEQDQKDVTLLYRGSANQRLIDLNRTRAAGQVVLWDPGSVSMSRLSH